MKAWERQSSCRTWSSYVHRRLAVPAFVASAFAILFFGLGSFLGARPVRRRTRSRRCAPKSISCAERSQLRPARPARPPSPSIPRRGIPRRHRRGRQAAAAERDGPAARQLLRERRQSFVELYSYDDRGSSNYGTAGYLGNGYFITVKHGVVALGQEGLPDPRQINSIKLMYEGRRDHGARRRLRRRAGRSRSGRLGDPQGQGADRPAGAEREPRLRVRLRRPDLPARQRLLEGDHPLDRLRRAADAEQPRHLPDRRPPGRVGRRRAEREGELVGIPIGRMQGDYRFSFILPLREEMFRRVKVRDRHSLIRSRIVDSNPRSVGS